MVTFMPLFPFAFIFVFPEAAKHLLFLLSYHKTISIQEALENKSIFRPLFLTYV